LQWQSPDGGTQAASPTPREDPEWEAAMSSFVLLAQADNPGADGGAAGAAAGIFGGFVVLWLLFVVLAIAATIFWIWMLVDVLNSSKPTDQKILWAVVIVFTHFLGALIYFFVGRERRASTAPA
jgi:hypothetical protein